MGVGKFVMCILYCLYYAYKLGYSAAAGGAWISKGLERRVLLPLRAVVAPAAPSEVTFEAPLAPPSRRSP